MVGLFDVHKDKSLQWSRSRAVYMVLKEEHGSPPKGNTWVIKDSSVLSNDHTTCSNKLLINSQLKYSGVGTPGWLSG